MPLFAAAAHQPALLEPIRDYFERRVKQTLQHSGSPQTLLAIMLLADGLWMFDALGIPQLTGKLRKDVHQFVREWTRQAIEADRVKAPAKPAKSRGTKVSKTTT